MILYFKSPGSLGGLLFLNGNLMSLILTSEGAAESASYFESKLNVEHSVYEVIRIIDGVALFLEDHFQRLSVSTDLQKMNLQLEFQEFLAFTVRLDAEFGAKRRILELEFFHALALVDESQGFGARGAAAVTGDERHVIDRVFGHRYTCLEFIAVALWGIFAAGKTFRGHARADAGVFRFDVALLVGVEVCRAGEDCGCGESKEIAEFHER